MRLQAIVLTALFFCFALSLPGQVQAACRATSCTPIFASDANLSSPLSQVSGTVGNVPNVYVGYEVSCDNTSDRITIPTWVTTPEGNKTGLQADTTNSQFISVGGKTYFTGKIPATSLSIILNDPNSLPNAVNSLGGIKTSLWSGEFLCSDSQQFSVNRIQESCSITAEARQNSPGNYSIGVTVSSGPNGQLIPNGTYNAILDNAPLDVLTKAIPFSMPQNGTFQSALNGLSLSAGTYDICIVKQSASDILSCASQICSTRVSVDSTVPQGTPTAPVPGVGGGAQANFNLCKQAETIDQGKCNTCFNKGGIWTAFGCVDRGEDGNVAGIVQDLIRIGLGLAGGFVLLTILYGSFMLSTSSGNPKRVQEAQEMITSAVMGLFFVIFSIVILRFIGVSILRIPGFGT